MCFYIGNDLFIGSDLIIEVISYHCGLNFEVNLFPCRFTIEMII